MPTAPPGLRARRSDVVNRTAAHRLTDLGPPSPDNSYAVRSTTFSEQSNSISREATNATVAASMVYPALQSDVVSSSSSSSSDSPFYPALKDVVRSGHYLSYLPVRRLVALPKAPFSVKDRDALSQLRAQKPGVYAALIDFSKTQTLEPALTPAEIQEAVQELRDMFNDWMGVLNGEGRGDTPTLTQKIVDHILTTWDGAERFWSHSDHLIQPNGALDATEDGRREMRRKMKHEYDSYRARATQAATQDHDSSHPNVAISSSHRRRMLQRW